MKTLFTLIAISICSICFGQTKQTKYIVKNNGVETNSTSDATITVTDEIRLEQLGLLKKIQLSKGELLTIQQHEEDIKQVEYVIKKYKQRDSVYINMFLNNTISPHIEKGDTLESWKFVKGELELKFKPKKK